MKQCYKCKIGKDAREFNKNKQRKDGLNPRCRQCDKEWREANKEDLLRKKKEYYQANRHLMPERNRQKYIKHRDKQIKRQHEYYNDPENWIKRMLAKSKDRANKVGLEFNIEAGDLVIPTHCPYLGIELTFELGKGQLPSNASIDRIDSTKGYIKGNVQIISRRANTMKNDASQEELINFATSILGSLARL